MINNSQYMKIIQYLSILGGLETPPAPRFLRLLVCSSFLRSVCMFIVSKALLISSTTVIWLNAFAMVLFAVCNAVTVECCVLYPCCVGVFGMFAVM